MPCAIYTDADDIRSTVVVLEDVVKDFSDRKCTFGRPIFVLKEAFEAPWIHLASVTVTSSYSKEIYEQLQAA